MEVGCRSLYLGRRVKRRRKFLCLPDKIRTRNSPQHRVHHNFPTFPFFLSSPPGMCVTHSISQEPRGRSEVFDVYCSTFGQYSTSVGCSIIRGGVTESEWLSKRCPHPAQSGFESEVPLPNLGIIRLCRLQGSQAKIQRVVRMRSIYMLLSRSDPNPWASGQVATLFFSCAADA